MIPLLLGVQPAQSTTQSSTAGSSDSGSAFGDLLATVLPANQETADALDDTATEPETAEQLPAGTGSGAFVELQFQDRLATLGTGAISVPAETPAKADTASSAKVTSTIVDPVAAAMVTAATSTVPDPAIPATAGTAASVESEVPQSLVAAPDVDASATVNPLVAAFASEAAADSPAPVATNPGVVSLVSVATPGTRTNTAGNFQPVADEVEEPAAAPMDEVLVEPHGSTVKLEDRPAELAPESKPAQPAPTPGFQVPVHHDAARAARPETSLEVGAVSGGKTLAVENVVSREPQALPINRQLVGPISALAVGPHGERTLSVNIAPEALGPITVKARLGHEGMRVELTAPTEAGREALRAMLPELRRDLAATGAGTITVGTVTDAGTGAGTFSGGGQASMANDRRFGGGGLATASPGRQQDEESAPIPVHETLPSSHASSHLDVMA